MGILTPTGDTQPAAASANVAAAVTSTQLFASNPDAIARAVTNDSAAVLYLKYGTGASATSYTVKLDPGDYFEFPPPVFDGVVHGLWTAATGAARTTELS